MGDAPGTSNGLTASSTKRPKSLFQCAKCSFATDSGLEFQSHIPQHQTDSSTSQCPFCALCYTSASSLSRHLFIVHKVRDQDEEEPAAGSAEEVPVDPRENGLDACAAEPSAVSPKARRPVSSDPQEDGASAAQSQLQAPQDQDGCAPSPQV